MTTFNLSVLAWIAAIGCGIWLVNIALSFGKKAVEKDSIETIDVKATAKKLALPSLLVGVFLSLGAILTDEIFGYSQAFTILLFCLPVSQIGIFLLFLMYLVRLKKNIGG